MNVIVIPEDKPNDELILKPLIEAMLRDLGKASARVEVCKPDPTGWEGVKEWDHLVQILQDFPIAHLFILCVDRDGHEERRQILDDLEERAKKILQYPRRCFLAEHAWQEVEVWALAGIDWKLRPQWSWEAIRSERDAKEPYFKPIVRDRGLINEPHGGRRILGAQAARNYARVRQNCPEVLVLEDRIRDWIAATAQR